MTRADAKQRALAFWGEMGVVGRATALLALIGLVWTGVTAVFVTRSDFERYVHDRDATLARYLAQRDSAQAVRNVTQERFERDVLFFIYRDCVRRNGERNCVHPDRQ